MKQGLKYGFFFTLTLPLGCAFGAEQLKDDMSSTLQALNAITSKVEEAPALLQLTPEQLDAISPPARKSPPKPARRALSKRVSEPVSAASLAELKALQAKINQLNSTLGQQDQELKQLRQTARQDADARAEVAQLKQNLQENLQATEQMQQDLAAVSAVKAENSKDNGRLQQALDKSQQQSSTLQKQLDVLAKSHNDGHQESKALQAALNDSRQQASVLQKQLDVLLATQAVSKSGESETLKAQMAQSKQQTEAAQRQLATLTGQAAEKDRQMAALQNQLVALKEKAGEQQLENSVLQQQLAAQQKEVIQPQSASEIRDYAIGTSFAEDMLALLKEKVAQGVKVNNLMALAGVQDTFAGKLKLQRDQIDKALDATEVALRSNQQQQNRNIVTAGSSYIEQFKQQKQVKKDASGYFYRIDNVGNGQVKADSVVTVVVKESLTNGKVIKDMEAAGTSITQPLGSFPPMFRSALVQLQNHGSMTMVVPPALAYGDKGLPPDIPPGSTMIYNVKLLDVVAPADAVTPVK